MKHKTLETISMVLLVVGGICWGLIGVFNFEPIGAIFNSTAPDGSMMMSPITRLVYVLIGLSALYRLYMWARSR
jgi:hypothetical protein